MLDSRETKKEESPTPRLEVSCFVDGKVQIQSFDLNTPAGRNFHAQFASWAVKNGITYTGYPAKS